MADERRVDGPAHVPDGGGVFLRCAVPHDGVEFVGEPGGVLPDLEEAGDLVDGVSVVRAVEAEETA